MQVAAITGAGSGIGLASPRMLHDMGMAVVGVGRDPAKLDVLQETIGDPAPLAALWVDITAKDAPKRIADQALAREVITHMQAGSGIINVTSTVAMIGGKRGGAYSAAKGGLKSLTEHMACEYGPIGIRSNCVAPGVTMIDMMRHRIPLFEGGGEMINGQSIVVDGGLDRDQLPFAACADVEMDFS